MEGTLQIDNQSLPVDSFTGFEAIAEPFCFAATCAEDSDPELSLGQSARLNLTDANQSRTTAGVITGYEETYVASCTRYQFTLEPRLVLLKKEQHPRTWIHCSLSEIVNSFLINIGYHPWQIKWTFNPSHCTEKTWIQLPTENQFEFLQRILAEHGILYLFSTIQGFEEITFFNFPCPTNKMKSITYIPTQGNLHNTRSINNLTVRRAHDLTIQSSLWDLIPGSQCYLNAERYHISLNDDYYVTRIQHQAKKTDGLHRHLLYTNTVDLSPIHHPFTAKIKTVPEFPLPFIATVESLSDSPYLDSHGQYHVRYQWDHDSPATQASPATGLLSFSLGTSNDAFGFHSPLYPGCTVLVNCLYNDPCQPVILGVLADEQANSQINHQSLLASQKHRIIFSNDDPGMTLSGCRGKLIIQLGPNNLDFTAHEGTIAFTAAQNTYLSCPQAMHETCQNKIIQVKNNLAISASTLSFQANQQMKITVQEKLHAQAENSIGVNTLGTLQLETGKDCSFTAKTTSFDIRSGELYSVSKKATLCADHSILLQQKNAQITFKDNLALSCRNLHFKAKNKITFKGKINAKDSLELD